MARTLAALAAVTLSLALVGCSAPTTTTSGEPPAGSNPTAATQAPDGAGSVDCTALEGDDASAYSIGLQLLAQMRTQGVVDSIKRDGMSYDPDALERVLTKLKSLEGHDVLGDPIPDIEFYLEANAKGREILAVEGPVPQSMFDDLIAFEGELATFLGHQLSINAAYSDACG